MKKIVCLVVVLLASIGLSACYKERIILYLPTYYIDEQILKDFRKETGIKVKPVEFESNEIAVSSIKTSAYDIVVPSDYAIEELILSDDGYLDEIDWSKITSFDPNTDMTGELKSMLNEMKDDGLDVLKYGVPFFWGNCGILYNKNTVTTNMLDEQGWNIFQNPNLRVMLYDSSKDVYMMALKQTYANDGLTKDDVTVNTYSVEQLQKATNWILTILDNEKHYFKTDEVSDDMVKANDMAYDVCLVYNGDAMYLMNNNDKVGYYIPETGTNVYVDAMCIPKNSTKKEYAYQFINYYMSYEVSLANAEEWGYASPRQDVVDYILGESIYPNEYAIVFHANDEVYRYVPEKIHEGKTRKDLMESDWQNKIRTN